MHAIERRLGSCVVDAMPTVQRDVEVVGAVHLGWWAFLGQALQPAETS